MPTVSKHSDQTTCAEFDATVPHVLVLENAHIQTSNGLNPANLAHSVTCMETQLLTLESVAELHEQQREELQAQIASLEDDIQSLETANRSLKQTIEQKNHQINQIIDNYETIIDAKDRHYRNRRNEHTSPGTSRPLLTALVERFK